MVPAGRVWRLAYTMVVVASCATLLGSQWYAFDLFAPFQAYLALVWLLALGLFAGLRRARLAFQRPGRAAGGAVLLLLLHLALLTRLYWPTNPAPPTNPATPTVTLSVVWFNMKHDNAALRALESEFAAFAPDLLALGETNRDTQPDPRWGLTHVMHDQSARIGIWSRWPLEDRRAHAVAGDRDVVDAVVVVDGLRLPVSAVHWRLPTRPSQQVAASFLAGLVRSRSPCLVLGDFNATPWSASLRMLQKEGGLWRARLPFGSFNSWAADPWHLLGVPIDHILFRGALRVEDVGLLPWNVSDHRPLRGRLTFTIPQ
jgi:endonuclease/exonuclease/phosphatase (EEP) superfamily protein YafD